MASIQLHVKPDFNYEEAAHAASDIVGNLENLPGEVSFLLEEIREKDQRIDALLARIHQRHYGVTKHVSKLNTSTPSNPNGPQLPLPPNSPLPTGHLTQKEALAITKIQSEWEKIEILQDEKVKLADRMERIVSRARERARAEWVKVGGLDIEDLEGGWEGNVGGDIVLPPSGLGSGSDRQRKRRPQPLPLPLPSSSSSNIIHPPSSMLPPPAPTGSRRTHPPPLHQPQKSSRSSRKSTSRAASDEEMDGEGEDEGEYEVEGEGAEDDGIYCTCQRRIDGLGGEMIGCDNDDCPVQWYHLNCVGVKEPLPEVWYCPSCVVQLKLSSSSGNKSQKDKRGRKK